MVIAMTDDVVESPERRLRKLIQGNGRPRDSTRPTVLCWSESSSASTSSRSHDIALRPDTSEWCWRSVWARERRCRRTLRCICWSCSNR